MPKTAKKIALVAAAFILVVFAIFLLNQTVSDRPVSASGQSHFRQRSDVGSHLHLLHPASDSLVALVSVAQTDAAARNDRGRRI